MQTIDDLIDRARRRLLLNEALGQIAFAAAIAAGGLAVVLLLGTRYLEWWTIALLGAAALATGVVRVVRRMPGAYAIAQRVDRSAELHDLISTAIYFSGAAGKQPARKDLEVIESQRSQAETAAHTVNLESTFPLRFPRAIYPLAALSLLASSLVVLRFAMTRSLDLRAPITEVLFEDLLAPREVKKPQPPASAKSFKALKAAEALMAKLNSPTAADQKQDADALDKAIDQALAPPKSDGQGKSEKAGNAAKTGQQQQNANGSDQSQNGDPLNGNQNAANQDSKSPQAQQGGNPNEKNKSGNGADGNSSSLLSKLKDAVSNMFSRSRQDGSQEGQKSPSQQASQSAKSQSQKSGKQSSGKGQQQAGEQAEAQEGDPNGDPQEGQQGQGKNAAKSSAENSAQAGSGIGNQNGLKDLRAADQLKAMGRISEIIGKRAATITGETMIEVQSGNQQLKTAYTERDVVHGESDSDVTRDEIPPALQTYVANYFEQVRKPAAKAPDSKAPALKQ